MSKADILQEGEHIYYEPRKATFRKECFDYIHKGIIDEEGNTWTTTEIDVVNYAQVYNRYRALHGVPFPGEISALRAYYGVSAAMMSEIMGFGTNQWRLYETDEVPSESNARAICAIRNKSVFLDFLEAARCKIGDRAYTSIRERVAHLPDYVRISSPTETSGYVSYSAKKTSEVVKYFARQMSGVFVTKMNKLLFYADFLKYKRKGEGMTGLEYRALTYGPVPNRYGEVYSRAEGVEMEDFIYPDGTSGQILRAVCEPDLSVFSDGEKEILAEVCELFRNASAGSISETSHREKGWIDCEKGRNLIPYSYAFYLNE